MNTSQQIHRTLNRKQPEGVVENNEAAKLRDEIVRLRSRIAELEGDLRNNTESSLMNEIYHSAVTSMHEGALLLNAEGRIRVANASAERLLGKSAQGLKAIALDDQLWQMVTEDGTQLIGDMHPVRLALQTARSVSHPVVRIQREDNSEVWVSMSVRPVSRDDLQRTTAVVVTLNDITEHKLTLDRQKATENMFRSLVEASSVGIYIIQDGTFPYVNTRFAEVFGYTVEEVTAGMRVPDFVAGQDRDLVAENIDKRMSGEAKSLRYSFRGVRKDKEIIYLEVHGSQTIFNGNPAVIGTLLDITERQRTENQLRTLSLAVEQSPVSIIITDTSGNIEYVNPKFTRLTGYTLDEVKGKNPRMLKSGEKTQEDYRSLWETILSGKEWRGEFHNKKKSGEYFWEIASISPIKDTKGTITHFVAVKEDITERKSLEAQFFRAQRLESLGTLAGGIAHDLNNVLAPILMGVEILKSQGANAGQQKILDTIESSANRGKNIVQQVLTFARGNEGDKQVLQPRYLIKEIEHIIRETFPRLLEIGVSVPKNLWKVSGDATHLHQVLMNLCVNARDAMPSYGVLRLSASNMEIDDQYAKTRMNLQPGKYVVLTVTDTGSGIPLKLMDKIFDPFFTTKGPGKGTGLGLSTVHTIVKNHNGYIDVTSEPGKGSTFAIFLPAVESRADEAPDAAEKEIPSGNGELILLIDDERSIREVTKETLESHGYRVCLANDGTDAIILFAEQHHLISLVITDMMMPFMDGQSVVRSMRTINPNVRIIASSGIAREQLHDIDSLNTDGYLAKPYSARQLLTTIQNILSDSNSRHSFSIH